MAAKDNRAGYGQTHEQLTQPEGLYIDTRHSFMSVSEQG